MGAIASRLGQQATVRQGIGLTPALQQSIKLLELSNLALAELMAEALAENPLLELAEAPAPGKPSPCAGRYAAHHRRALCRRAWRVCSPARRGSVRRRAAAIMRLATSPQPAPVCRNTFCSSWAPILPIPSIAPSGGR